MESLVAASAFANPSWVPVLGGAFSVLALAATGFVLGRTAAEHDTRLLASGRVGCTAFCGLLVVAAFLGLLSRWAFAVACVAFLMALLAVALRFGQGTSLRGYLEARGGEEEPAWWPAFERGFRRYASTSRREQNPLRRAVTRTGSQTADRDCGRVARRSPDVTSGWLP